MDNKFVYLDNNATTQVAPEVWQLMSESQQLFGNASSMHGFGRAAAMGISKARGQVASLIGANKDEIYFTSGATESNNIVFNIGASLIDKNKGKGRIVTTTIEHPAIIETAKYLRSKGYTIDLVNVDSTGLLDLEDLKNKLDKDVVLVSVMSANNETGTIQPIREAAALAHEVGALFHSDATQSIGKMEISMEDIGIDYLSLSGHKFYGPKGIGVLATRNKAPIFNLMHGGHQEKGYRPGTYNNFAIIGLGKACDIAKRDLSYEKEKLWEMREALRKGILERIDEVIVNGNQEHCLPGTLNVSFPGAEGESILLYLDMEGIAVSTGSACATGSLEPSYVLLAGGLDIEIAHGSIRFSLGRYNSMEDVDYVLEKLPPIIKRIREMSTR
jgi:cysteine desulfurase